LIIQKPYPVCLRAAWRLALIVHWQRFIISGLGLLSWCCFFIGPENIFNLSLHAIFASMP